MPRLGGHTAAAWNPRHRERAAEEGITEYVQREVLPQVPDAWIDESLTKVGYEIPLDRHFYKTIHPFSDGNGRLGRLLIVLYLVSFGLLAKPALYLSDFFERHKGEYYDQLMAVRTTSKLTPWLSFFLLGVRETGASSI